MNVLRERTIAPQTTLLRVQILPEVIHAPANLDSLEMEQIAQVICLLWLNLYLQHKTLFVGIEVSKV